MAMEFEAGKYNCRIVGQQLTTNAKENPQLVFTIEPVSEINPDDPSELWAVTPGKQRTVYRVITDKTVERIVKELRALGYDGDGFDKLDPELGGDEFYDLSGREVQCTCSSNVWEGRESERWEFWIDGVSGSIKKGETIAAKKARELNSKFKDFFKAIPAAGEAAEPDLPKPKPKPAGAKPKASATADDIPF